MGVCNCSMFCCTLLYVHSSVAIILMGKRELVALLNLSSWLSGSSSRFHGVVCGLRLWYFLIILTYYFSWPFAYNLFVVSSRSFSCYSFVTFSWLLSYNLYSNDFLIIFDNSFVTFS